MLIRLQDAVADADASLAVDEGVSVALSLGSVLTSGGGHAVRAVGPTRMRIAGLAQGRNHIALHVEHIRAVRMRLPADDEILKIILGGIQLFMLRKEGKIMVEIKEPTARRWYHFSYLLVANIAELGQLFVLLVVLYFVWSLFLFLFRLLVVVVLNGFRGLLRGLL